MHSARLMKNLTAIICLPLWLFLEVRRGVGVLISIRNLPLLSVVTSTLLRVNRYSLPLNKRMAVRSAIGVWCTAEAMVLNRTTREV